MLKWSGLLLASLALLGCGQSSEFKQPLVGQHSLTIYSTTDSAIFEPVIDDFNRTHPTVTVQYFEMESKPLYEQFLAEEDQSGSPADLLLSSAMDLQVKLVNDGYASSHYSENAADIPTWANWRNEAFGFTFEPVVMVFNRQMMSGHPIPQSRPQLLELLRKDGDFLQGRIGTYDIESSGVGYFIASQDARSSSDFGALFQAMRDADAVKANTTSELLDLLDTGKIAIGINLLGSYARARAAKSPHLELVYLQDYTLAVSRTAIIPKNAPNTLISHIFLEYLLSRRGQQVLTKTSGLSAVRPEVSGRFNTSLAFGMDGSQLRPIALGPGLLVYLDQQKRARFLQNWGQ